MHPGRRSILVRWIAYAVVIVATAAWLYTNQRIDVPRQSGIAERLAPKQVTLPRRRSARPSGRPSAR
jgi:hypothetical protein